MTKVVIQSAKVGALVVAALVAAFLLYRAVDETTPRGGGYRVYALMGNAQGLITKSRVTIAGISIGRIEDIRLEGEMARIDIQIDEGVALYEDAMEHVVSPERGEFRREVEVENPSCRA